MSAVEHLQDFFQQQSPRMAALADSIWSLAELRYAETASARLHIDALEQAGFRSEETDPVWIYKAFKDGVMLDIIFMVTGGIYLDEEMEQRSVIREYDGLAVRIPSPEDQIVIKAIVHREETSRHWFDALAILGRAQLEWEYLLHRARLGARRVLALLIYAQSMDILIPNWLIRRLYEEVCTG